MFTAKLTVIIFLIKCNRKETNLLKFNLFKGINELRIGVNTINPNVANIVSTYETSRILAGVNKSSRYAETDKLVKESWHSSIILAK